MMQPHTMIQLQPRGLSSGAGGVNIMTLDYYHSFGYVISFVIDNIAWFSRCEKLVAFCTTDGIKLE